MLNPVALLRRLFWILFACSLAGLAQPSPPGAAAPAPSVRIGLDQAIQLALAHNPSLAAARAQIPQSQAQEVTAGLRPNPVLTWDALYLPLFNPGALTLHNLNTISEFDGGVSYLIERGHKRQRRIEAARDQTGVVQAQVADAARTLSFNVAQQYIAALLAQSDLQAARAELASFQRTVIISRQRFKAGAISRGDLLKIEVQQAQFQTDVNNARLALEQARTALRALLGPGVLPENFQLAGTLQFQPLHGNQDDMLALALKARPDLLAAQRGITAAQSQYRLAQANGKRDLTVSATYTHLNGLNNAGASFNIEIPLFNRNQGEIARTRAAITQATDQRLAVRQQVLSDVRQAWEAVAAGTRALQIYQGGALQQSRESVDISRFAYTHGAATLLDFLDAERSDRQLQQTYRDTLAAYLLSLEQLRETVGTRNLP